MARKPKFKELANSRLLKDYASWIYCTECNKAVAYLCYVTYDLFDFKYNCTCGNVGSVRIEFEHDKSISIRDHLIVVKNRLCCPQDNSPLISIVDKNLESYNFDIICNTCNNGYSFRKKMCK